MIKGRANRRALHKAIESVLTKETGYTIEEITSNVSLIKGYEGITKWSIISGLQEMNRFVIGEKSGHKWFYFLRGKTNMTNSQKSIVKTYHEKAKLESIKETVQEITLVLRIKVVIE